MNPITFNEPFKAFLKFAPRVHDWPTIEAALAAPLFEYDLAAGATGSYAEVRGSDEALQVAFSNNGTLHLPFPVVRVQMRDRRDGNGDMDHIVFNGTMERGQPCAWVIINVKRFPPQPGFPKIDIDLMGILMFRHLGNGQMETTIRFYQSKKKKYVELPLSGQSRREFSGGLVDHIATFLYDVFSPANHIAKVTPDGPGKSVQWREARAHYVMLDRRHEANRKDMIGVNYVFHDDKLNRERISHSRRAHYRTFRHERYTAAKGRRVWIKSIWVGPKVWRDLIGSTYQIVR